MTKSTLAAEAAPVLIVCCLLAGRSFAQVPPPTSASKTASATQTSPAVQLLQQVTVSSSRIRAPGFEAPTPVSVIDASELARLALPDIADAVRELPELGPSDSPLNSGRATYLSDGSAGLDLLNLRDLGAQRTLVLLDGQRMPDSNLSVPGVDISTIPQTLIKRVDVVTGGASAAWGSDAIAGVVNFVLDDDFTGLKANLDVGNNWQLQTPDYKGEISYGTGFADNRGHAIVSGSYETYPDAFFQTEIQGDQMQRLVTNPAYAPGNGQPQLILANNVGLATATPGGIITGGPLKGIYFVGPDATPERFDYGNVSNDYYSNGGTSNTGLSQSDFGEVTNPFTRRTLFGYFSYDLTDNVKGSVQLDYGRFQALGNSWTAVQYGTLNIQSGNPFIPASIQKLMTAEGITSFPLGTTLTQDMAGTNSVAEEANSVGMPVVQITRNLYRGVANLDGETTLFSEPWSWNTYAEHAEVYSVNDPINNPQTARITNAVDAVTVTPQNVGNSGFPIGSIVCASSLTNPNNGCAPLDVFGTGIDDSAAAAYINAVARAGGDTSIEIIRQNVFAASASGELPIGLKAGNISAAIGYDYRNDSGYIRSTPAAIAQTFYVAGNTLPFNGSDSVNEGFAEINAPILKNQGVKSLNLDLAGRFTDYKPSGSVISYKAGLLTQLNNVVRLRGTYSQDIRAPTLYQLYSEGQSIGLTFIDPHTNKGVYGFEIQEGNPHLRPEIAHTLSLGTVLTPLPNLDISVDWWRIHISQVITSVSTTTITSQCAAGVASFCNLIVFGGPNGALSEVLVEPVNGPTQQLAGIDTSGYYTMGFLRGTLNLRYNADYTYQNYTVALGVTCDLAGAVSTATISGCGGSYPKFKGTLAGTYQQNNWQITAQGQIYGSAVLSNYYGPLILSPDNNRVPAVALLDLMGSIRVHSHVELYAAIDNVLNTEAPIVTGSGGSDYGDPYNDLVYDVFGREWRAGVRVGF